MNEKQLRTVVGNLRRAISPNPASRISDAQLLERFLTRRDELAFEMLVWRHGSMVLNVCRRVLRDAHEAEDAFQATFLIFVRKLGSIGKRQSVGSWLYKVAYRVALRARQRAAVRRSEPERDWDQVPSAGALDDPAHRALWNDLRPVLDEEVNQLPEKYRTPFVLFYLEGMAYPEVAEELGCPKGTVSSRLTTAKGLLRKRLARRGVALSAALLGAVLARAASAAVTIGLTNATVQTIRLIARGQTAGGGAVSAQAVSLAEGVMRTMMMTKMKLAAALVLAVGLLGFGTSIVVQHTVHGAQPAPGSKPNDAAKPPPGIAVGEQIAADRPVLFLPDKPPLPAEDALSARLAKVEERLTKLEAQMAKLQAKPPGSKPDNPFGSSPRWSSDDYFPKSPAEEKLWTIESTQFKLPIQIGEKEQAAIAEVVLYMSADQGKTWQVAAKLAGDQREFPVNVPHNGVYWFKLHVVYKLGPTPKPDFEAWKPDLKVRVAAKKDNTDTLLNDLETQLKELQDRIAELKAKKGEKPKP